jgi:hypothetical protein
MLVSIPLNWSPFWSSNKAMFINVCSSSSRFIFAWQHHVSQISLPFSMICPWPKLCCCNQYVMHDKCWMISLHIIVHWSLPHVQPRSLNWKMPMAKQRLSDSSGNKTLIDSVMNTIVSIVWFLHIGLYIAVNHLHWPWWQNQKELQCFCAYHVSWSAKYLRNCWLNQ